MSWRAQATFRDVMVPNQLALRADGRPIKSGPTTTSVHAPTALGVTQRRTQRNTSLTQENLTQTAATRRRRSEAHVVAAPDPPMRSAIRAETNRGICDQRRNQQALVLSLREVHLAATQDIDKLHRSDKALRIQVGEGPRRTLWLIQQCLAIRARRPRPEENDAVHCALQAERARALADKTAHETQLATNTQLLRDCSLALKALEQEIACEAKPLALAGEAHSGAVLRFARPQGEPPATVRRLRELATAARTQALISRRLCERVAADAKTESAAVNAALKASIVRLQREETKLTETRGETTLARQKTSRRHMQVEARLGEQLGPAEDRWLTTAERLQRPNVRTHASGRPQSASTIAMREGSHAARAALRSADSTLRRDTAVLAQTQKQLTQLTDEARRSREIDEEVLRLRRRSGPGTRVAVRP